MRVISIGDLVTDFYYKYDKLLGVMGGMTSHNIVANISRYKIDTSVFGVCGNDKNGEIAIKSLKDLGIDTANIETIPNIKTRTFHISYIDDKLLSKKRCPFCNKKNWYEESLINTSKILNNIKKDDILIFDNLNNKNQTIIDNTNNMKMLDLGQYFELENFSLEEIKNKINGKFDIINLNERVEKYLLKRFNFKSTLDIYKLFNSKLIIITRGKDGADFVFDNIIYNQKLEKVSNEIDSTGAGDAFFSIFIKEYINNNFQISSKFIDNTFKEATKLTNKVVKCIGARGHINKLYKIKKLDNCTCENLEIVTRKQIKRCNININNLEKRVLNATNSKAYDSIKKIDFHNINNALFIGTGGSFASAMFSSKVINNLYGVNTLALLPRDVSYRNNKKVDKVFLFSYSGTTNDLIVATQEIDNNQKYIVTKGEVQKIVEKTKIRKNNIISYRTNSNKSKERGFLSFEGTISPASLFLKLYFDEIKKDINVDEFIKGSINYWYAYFKNYFEINKKELKDILKKGIMFNIFTGDYTVSASIDLESKMVESGLFNCLVHEKKNFSHGRFVNYESISQKINIYLKQKETSDYEDVLLKYLSNDKVIKLESKYNGLLCEFDLLVAVQYLMYYISNFLNIDISKPNYSDESMKIYFYKGEL